MKAKQVNNKRVMDRTVTHTEALPDGYKCIDITEDFVPDGKNGIYGLRYVGTEQHPGWCGTHRDIMTVIRAGKTGFVILAIDRVYKELLYVRL